MLIAVALSCGTTCFAGPKRDLISGARSGVSLDRVKSAIAAGADVNAKMRSGKTALYTAVTSIFMNKRSLEIVKFLVENGANVNAKTNKGRTPLYMVRQTSGMGQAKQYIINYLVSKGAK